MPAKLEEIARRHKETLQRMAALAVADPEVGALVGQAREAVVRGGYDRANALLTRAEEAELAAIEGAEAVMNESQEVVRRRKLSAAAVRAEKGGIAMTRLRYREAADHFRAAANLVPAAEGETRAAYLDRHANALYTQGNEQGDNPALSQAIALYRQLLEARTRERVPLDWAMTQNNLGNALHAQGMRTRGEAGQRLAAQALGAYRQALEVFTPAAQAPQWLQTQGGLAEAYLALEEWGKAAAVYAEVLRAFPDDAGAYVAALELYHEKLHAFRDAFAVSERWLSRHPDDLAAESSLAESYFTNGRFAESESRIAALLAKDRLEPQTEIALRAVQIAALLAQEKTDAMAERLADLHAALAAQPAQFKGGWTFAGTNHFIAQHEGLRKHAWLSEVLTSVGAADRTTMLMVIERAQASIKAVARD